MPPRTGSEKRLARTPAAIEGMRQPAATGAAACGRPELEVITLLAGGRGLEETAKGVGRTVTEGAREVGKRAQETGKQAAKEAKPVGDQLHDSAKALGEAIWGGMKYIGGTLERFFTGKK
jgi:hypothetical protein